jgi:alpha-tubulin suppressor-like RCC1 family protein
MGHLFSIMPDGSVYTCGLNTDGQLGLGDFADRSLPTKVSGISGAVSVSCGGKHTYVTTKNGIGAS